MGLRRHQGERRNHTQPRSTEARSRSSFCPSLGTTRIVGAPQATSARPRAASSCQRAPSGKGYALGMDSYRRSRPRRISRVPEPPVAPRSLSAAERRTPPPEGAERHLLSPGLAGRPPTPTIGNQGTHGQGGDERECERPVSRPVGLNGCQHWPADDEEERTGDERVLRERPTVEPGPKPTSWVVHAEEASAASSALAAPFSLEERPVRLAKGRHSRVGGHAGHL